MVATTGYHMVVTWVMSHGCCYLVVQVDSLQEMDAKIDKMAQSGALDPALLVTLAKAHTSVKDTDYTREEVKDVMAHLYFKVSPAQQPIQLICLSASLSLPAKRQWS